MKGAVPLWTHQGRIAFWELPLNPLQSLRLAIIACFGVLILAEALLAYTPDDPVVKAMVDRGLAYLEKSPGKDMEGIYEGGHILVGYTVYKVTGDKDHPLVQKGLKLAIRRADETARAASIDKIVYDASIAAVFLSDIDAVLYRPQLIKIRDFLKYAQKRHGGFGYLNQETGDTSQVQYAMLAMWAMHKNEVDIPPDLVEQGVKYLQATQDPTGGWGYQGLIPKSGLVAQDSVTKSLATAGIGGLLIGADILGILGKRSLVEEDPDIPKAFTRIDLALKERAKMKNSGVTLKLEDLTPTITKATDYQQKTPYAATGKGWGYYYRYSEERYESFLEILTGKREKSPNWYNLGVTELKKLQDNQGAWGNMNADFCPPDVCTAFAMLYLIRSTQKTIAKLNEGLMAGGYGLPKNGATVRRVGDRIVSEETASVDGLLEMMEKNNVESVEVGLLPEDLALSKDTNIRKSQVSRLARLLSSRDANARRIAARLIGRSEDINQVPELIYALTDNDQLVPLIAEEGLRLLTRKLTVRHVDIDSNRQQKQDAALYWRKWYLSMRPDYVFVDR